MGLRQGVYYESSHLTKKEKEWRAACENSFEAFVAGVAPWLVTGHIHADICNWIQSGHEAESKHLLALLPRAHLKSTLVYLYVCWRIVLNPAIIVIYASASSKLAELQLGSIKRILTGDIVSHYWPGLISGEETKGKREVWRLTEINVDHPFREDMGIRDFTVMSVSIGKTITGGHNDLFIMDDIVAPESTTHSPWTADGRSKLDTWYSFAASVLNPDGDVLAIGTRYHAKDLYNKLINLEQELFDNFGNVVGRKSVYKNTVKVVQESGNFLWPRKQGTKGDWYGFDFKVLSSIKANYLDKAKFFSQYYQDPTDPEGSTYGNDIQYYAPESLVFRKGSWYLKTGIGQERILNVFAAVDIASTENKNSDYTAIVIVGVDHENIHYILHISRFQTEKISVIVDEIFRVYEKWRWRTIRIETVAAQRFVLTSVKEDMRTRNAFFNVDDFTPTPAMGKKQERIRAVLEPRYSNNLIKHYRGGNCEILESELVLEHPPHDDISDALAAVCEITRKPTIIARGSDRESSIKFHPKWGGVLR